MRPIISETQELKELVKEDHPATGSFMNSSMDLMARSNYSCLQPHPLTIDLMTSDIWLSYSLANVRIISGRCSVFIRFVVILSKWNTTWVKLLKPSKVM
ncbi:hypothetical protein ES703_42114 [subsurface metagenome]